MTLFLTSIAAAHQLARLFEICFLVAAGVTCSGRLNNEHRIGQRKQASIGTSLIHMLTMVLDSWQVAGYYKQSPPSEVFRDEKRGR